MRLFKQKLKKPKRITISLDGQLEEILNQIQKELQLGEEIWSISKTINVLLLAGILSENALSSLDWSRIQSLVKGTRIGMENISVKEFVLNLLEVSRLNRENTLPF